MRPPRTANKILKASSSRGQGTLEFVLILVVAVGLVLILSSKVFKPFGEFANSYMGSYLACLLDKGVLPKLKSDDDSCADSLRLGSDNPYNPKNAAKTKAARDASTASKPSEVKEMERSRAGGSGNSASNTSAGSRGRFNTPKAADGAGAGDEKVTSVPNPLAESKYYKVSRFGAAGQGRGTGVRALGLDALLQGEKDRLKKREQRISRAGIVESESELGKPKKMRVKIAERKIAEVTESEPLTLGKFVRILIILAIILAIVVFLGTQANQISKSWEK